MSWNYQELAATLRAEMRHHQPIVVVKCEDDDSDRDRLIQPNYHGGGIEDAEFYTE